jgi:hypothetical protein
MPNGVYNRGKFLVGQGRVTASAALRMMLTNTGYVFDPDHNLVDDGTTNDPLSYEISVGGYARQSLAGLALAEDDALDFAYLDANDPVFASLATGQTVGGAVVYVYSSSGGSTSDTGQELLEFFDVTDTPTNGGNITITIATSSQGCLLKYGTTS